MSYLSSVSLLPNFKGSPNPFENEKNKQKKQQAKNAAIQQREAMSQTLQGVLLTKYIKDNNPKKLDLYEFENGSESFDYQPSTNVITQKDVEIENEKNKKGSLIRNAAPYCISALLATSMAVILSNAYLKSQKLLQPGNIPQGIKLPTVGKNINLRTEEYFAIYMAISEPKSKNVIAMLGVFAMGALAFIGKTVIDGTKKVWLKKQESDVKKNYEDKVIDIETASFSGKLDVIRKELAEKTKYFKEKLGSEELQNTSMSAFDKTAKDETMIFGQFINFKGAKEVEKNDEKPKNTLDKIKSFYDKFKDSPIGLIAVGALTLGLVALGGKKAFSNIAKGVKAKENAINLNKEKIRDSIKQTVNEYVNTGDETKKSALLEKIKEKLLSLTADSDEIKDTFTKAGFKDNELKTLVDEVSDSVSKLKFGDKFYVQADPAMGGREGTQFYIYIDEAKGYIYDVITHPENKFAKYLFSAITATGATGYILKEIFDAVKEAAVIKENSNTELSLQKRLIETEIRNFKSKKLSAIEPMMAEFDTKLKQNRPKEELKALAEDILLEIKNGPPFVYS